MSSSKNFDSRKTSFLNKSNSAFIEQMYLKFIEKDPELPQSWKDYFEDLDEELNLVVKEINGPSWQRTKKIDEILDYDGPLVVDVNCHEHHTYEPRIFGWNTPIEDMYPYLDRDEFKKNMYIKPIDGWEKPIFPNQSKPSDNIE